MEHLQPAELKRMLQQQPAPLLLDVREHWEYDLARIEGSTLIPMGEIVQRQAELDKQQPIAVICHHGVRSLQVAMFLERQGFARVYNLTGGVDAWSREVDPEVPIY